MSRRHEPAAREDGDVAHMRSGPRRTGQYHGRVPIPTPVTEPGRAGLAAIIEEPRGALLAFDYDGVLAPIVDDPRESLPFPGSVAALGRLARRVGTVAIISGRPAAVVVEFGRLAEEPALDRLVVFGLYGQERWDAHTNRVVTPPASEEVRAVIAELPVLLAHYDAPPETWIEDKGGSVAVHTRRCSDPAAALAALASPIADCAARHGLLVEPGRYVLELRPSGVDKGQTLLSYAKERSARSVCYTGDDLGDLKAFDAVEALRGAGIAGLKVGSGSAEVAAVAQRADVVVDGPAGVLRLVEGLINAIDSSSTRNA
jgi:trehalose 6-phosphate phosphatase